MLASVPVLHLEQYFNYVLLFEHECNLVLKSVRRESFQTGQDSPRWNSLKTL